MLDTNHLIVFAIFALTLFFLGSITLISLVALALGHPKIVPSIFSVINRIAKAVINLLDKYSDRIFAGD